jgi:hypothetical protein
MNLSMKNNTENVETENIVPLGNNDIKSVLQKKSESVFEEKNISSKTDFIKKSLIEIALDFETQTKKDDNNDNPNKSESPKDLDGNKIEKNEDENNTALLEKQSVIDTSEILEEETTALSNENVTETSKVEDAEVNINNKENNESSKNSDIENNSLGNKNPETIESEQIDSHKDTSNDVSRLEVDNNENNNSEETKQALDSVRDAVSKSINNIGNGVQENLESNDLNLTKTSDIISKDFQKFQNVFSNLSELAETAIYNTMHKKIIEIAYDLAGYQIDKMPEKYEKKIKSLLKNINCFEDKITIEINEEDYQAISKLEKFSDGLDKSIFVPNKDLFRGDIILNCDGMHYSEKRINN